MTTTAVHAAAATQVASSAANPGGELNLQTFLQLLTTELANQNPTDPMSDADFYSQVSSLGMVQGMADLKSSMQVQQAASMLGKTATVFLDASNGGGSSGSYVTGTVKSLTNASGTYKLEIQKSDGTSVYAPMNSLVSLSS